MEKIKSHKEIPCEACPCLAICKSQSLNYEYKERIINDFTFNKCRSVFYKVADEQEIEIKLLLNRIRVFLRPDLDYLWGIWANRPKTKDDDI